MLNKIINNKIGLVTFVVTLFFFTLHGLSGQSFALSGSSFKSGKIISDSLFFKGDAMSATQIQNFLNAKVPKCDTNGEKPYGNTTRKAYSASKGVSTPFICLKNYKANTPEKQPISGVCNYIGAKTNRTAAQIIDDVAKACGVSQKVLIVLLQKEQSLITDDWPWPIQYRSATGYGCPDTAPCDSEFYGFFNQVYHGARIYKVYAKSDGPNYFRHQNNSIKWHPNSSCGRSTVYIENQATAGLYNYTPYRPNKAALDNLFGTGNSCSSYGNRNFWRIYNGWFGSTIKQESVRYIECNGQKYLLENNYYTKRSLTSNAIKSLGLAENDFQTDGYGCDYPTFTTPLEKLVRSRETNKLYLIDEQKAYSINSQTDANAWGLGNINQEAPYMTSSAITDRLTTLPYVPRLAKSTNSERSDIYVIDNDQRFTIAGTPSNETSSYKLIRGDSKVKLGVFSVELLQELSTAGEIDYSFKINGDWYLFDYGKTRKINDNVSSRFDDILSGPALNASILNSFNENLTLSSAFKRGNYFYRYLANSTLEYTNYDSLAKDWGIIKAPIITQTLTNKLSQSSTLKYFKGLNGNARLIQCGSTKFIIERFIPTKRQLTTAAIDAWNLENHYFKINESKGCGYTTYSTPADQVIRSRSTKKLYYVENGKAYHIYNQAIANQKGDIGNVNQNFPQFESKSISDTLNVSGPLLP